MTWFIAFLRALFSKPAPVPVVVAPEPVKSPVEAVHIDTRRVITDPPKESPTERMAHIARKWLGKDPSTPDIADDELGCADSVSVVIREVYPDFKHTVSTATLFKQLKQSKHFKGSLDPVPGCIIVSPTEGSRIGHTGIYTQANKIASNNSYGPLKGKWTENYTRESWRNEFITKRRLKGYFFIPV